MKMVMVFCSGPMFEEARRLLEEHKVPGYTAIPEVIGLGVSGSHFGSRVWPRTSALILSLMEDDLAAVVVAALGVLKRTRPGASLHAAILLAESFV
jgi:hypothetical protein